MNIFLSSTVLASVLAPAFSFSYLESLGGGNPVAAAPPAAAAPSNGASYLDALTGAPAAPVPAAPVPAAPAAPYESSFAEVDATASNYFDALSTGTPVSGPGVSTHVDTLNTGSSLMGGAGIQTHVSSLPVSNSLSGGAGFQTHVDSLSPSSPSSYSSPFASSASFSGSTSADGVSFTLETGDISGLVDGLGPGGTLRLTGSIDNVSYN